mmetsp:Transcript_23377/g.51632  ORF Transcript_23377/g.51632 Transcript_23377/m.51632 type:complete len:311 (+) Transcript_23377:68-1000(+)|eukprot:CAMPEP_0170592338 /NCGR_PEP_ID=MMETSP0224-20130122/12872_1 /TAXON_ID=285029 /ORGANISM="Togula jolla, Strain CCCM 725" /LENGTH=310 /DNA_ID=CAMNT_0010916239 /DNA_START=60 /DNA_END=992 /DNA_ORIENTATION=+
MFVQVGAGITDWVLAAVCFYSFAAMRQHARASTRPTPQWYRSFEWAFLSEGFSCFFGAFMWLSGANQNSRIHIVDFVQACPMIVGMAGEALALLLVANTMRTTMKPKTFEAFGYALAAAIVMAFFYVGFIYFGGLPVSLTLQPCTLLAVAFPLLLVRCLENSFGEAAGASGAARSHWRRLLAGTVLNLCGAASLGTMDNDCTGRSCISEFLPWESSPCRWVTAEPMGSTCPLPEWFNHAAVMHIFCIVACFLSVSALCGLLDCNWEPKDKVKSELSDSDKESYSPKKVVVKNEGVRKRAALDPAVLLRCF